MKENNTYNIVLNTFSIFRLRRNIAVFTVSAVFFGGLFAFFYGLFTIPMPGGDIGFYRMEPPTSFEMFYMVFSIIASALIVTLTIHAIKIKVDDKVKGKNTSMAGLATGIFGAVCPACLGINFLAFGNVFTAQLSFLIPYIFWIQLGGIALLSGGLYLVAKSTYEKKCASCLTERNKVELTQEHGVYNKTINKSFVLLLVVVASIFAYQVFSAFNTDTLTATSSSNMLVTGSGEKVDINSVIEAVTPKDGFETTVQWGDVVGKMIETGVLNPQELEDILVNRYDQEMKPEWRAILNGEDSTLSINSDNAVFMMYMLWALAKDNQNQILTDSPIANYFTNYDIGVGKPGYDDTLLLALTPQQQVIAESVSRNAYRPCCGNSTAVPDCSHGYSALGLVQLMASQDFSEKEIFETFIQFNSFWFPETYIKNALYFKITENIDWSEVDKALVAGKEYSTLQGSYVAKNYLKTNFGI